MKPMVINSTPFIKYHNIKVEEIDIYDDAWGFNTVFCVVFGLLRNFYVVPERSLTTNLIKKIRKKV
jgi:hypothetical protein